MDMNQIIKTITADLTVRPERAGRLLSIHLGQSVQEIKQERARVAAEDDDTLMEMWRSLRPMGTNYQHATPMPGEQDTWVAGMYMTREQVVNRIADIQVKQKGHNRRR